MAVAQTSTFRRVVRITRAKFIRLLAGSPAASAAGAVYDYAVARGIDPLLIIAIFRHESSFGTAGWATKTRSWGNTRPPSFGAAEIGAYQQDSGRYTKAPGPYEQRSLCAYANWTAGGLSTVARLVEHVYRDRDRIEQIFIHPTGQVWAPAGDANNPDGYLNAVITYMNLQQDVDEATEGQIMNPQERTDAMIAALRAAGCEVIDVRGKLPVNPHPANRYGLVRGGLGGVTKVVQHWTGDSFNRATVRQVTGTDYGVDRISEAMSVDDELDMLRWYANYHISKDGGSWGGIAYGTLFFPSGRVYVAWNIGTLTYHAFSVNGYSYALCCPNANGQALTPRQLAAMNRTWLYLFEETPEIPAAWADLLGHAEAKRFDAQNQTSCPGPEILRHVQQARSTGKPTVSLASNAAGAIADGLGKTPTAPDGEAANPSALRLDVPGLGERWIIEPILSTWREAGGVFGNPNAPGYPRSGMYAEGDTMIQWFERARIEVKGETVSFGLVGLEAAQAAGKAA